MGECARARSRAFLSPRGARAEREPPRRRRPSIGLFGCSSSGLLLLLRRRLGQLPLELGQGVHRGGGGRARWRRWWRWRDGCGRPVVAVSPPCRGGRLLLLFLLLKRLERVAVRVPHAHAAAGLLCCGFFWLVWVGHGDKRDDGADARAPNDGTTNDEQTNKNAPCSTPRSTARAGGAGPASRVTAVMRPTRTGASMRPRERASGRKRGAGRGVRCSSPP